MNKQEFIKAWADKGEITAKEADKLYDAFMDTVVEGLKADKKIALIGFGSFELKHKEAKKGVRNPLTGGTYDVPASDVPVVKLGKKFKELF